LERSSPTKLQRKGCGRRVHGQAHVSSLYVFWHYPAPIALLILELADSEIYTQFDKVIAELGQVVEDLTVKCEEILGKLPEGRQGKTPTLATRVSKVIKKCREMLETKPYTRIGFVGHRGAGKSTTINRLLGHAVLPTKRSSTSTSALTELIGHDPIDPNYHVKINYIRLQDWQEQFHQVHATFLFCLSPIDLRISVGCVRLFSDGEWR